MQPQKNNQFRAIDSYSLDVFADVTDFRDYIYQPPLIKIRNRLKPNRRHLGVLDQGEDGACAGFALAAAINNLNRQRGKKYRVSPTMLYQMARNFDEWPGNYYTGSSCRGAI